MIVLKSPLSSPCPAELPTNVLKFPLVCIDAAATPIAVFDEPELFDNALPPTPRLLVPDPTFPKADHPIAMLSPPVVAFCIARSPIATLCHPAVLSNMDINPIDTLPSDVERNSADSPSATFANPVRYLPAPLPTPTLPQPTVGIVNTSRPKNVLRLLPPTLTSSSMSIDLPAT